MTTKVTLAMRYVADAYCLKESPYQMGTQYDIRQSELLTYHCCCLGNLVTIAMRYVADAYRPKEPVYQIWIQYDIRQSYWRITVVAMVT